MANLPEETTQLLIDLCTSSGTTLEIIDTANEDTPDAANNKSSVLGSAATGGASYLSYLSLNRGQASDTATIPAPSIKTVRADSASVRDETSTVKNGDVGSHSDTPRTSSPPPSALPSVRP